LTGVDVPTLQLAAMPKRAADELDASSKAQKVADALTSAAEAAAKRKLKRAAKAAAAEAAAPKTEEAAAVVDKAAEPSPAVVDKAAEHAEEAAAVVDAADGSEGSMLNIACQKAKAAHVAAPKDESLATAYKSAKAAFRAFQQAREASRRERADPAAAQDDAKWTCEICNVTIKNVDGHAQKVHLEGKAHKRKAAAAALAAASTASEKAALGVFECKLCSCTGPLAARATHEAGAKHVARLAEIVALWETDALKYGDWVCVQHGAHVQHNYASKAVCRRATCDATREQGVPFEEVRRLAQAARRATKVPSEAVAATPAEAAAPVVASKKAIELSCRACAGPFNFTVREQLHYAAKVFAPPTRCLDCRTQKRKAEQSDSERAE
jgi:hypothetical protein